MNGDDSTQRITNLFLQLPHDLQQEVEDFSQFLFEKYVQKPKRGFKFDWAGALSDLKDQYTSVELQHVILEMRGE